MSCFFCSFDGVAPGDKYCGKCGKPVDFNFCSSDSCINSYDHAREAGTLKESDCRCRECGAKSTYFRDGLLPKP